MRRLRRVDPFVALGVVLLVVALALTAVAARQPGGGGRSASVYDEGDGGAASLRRLFEAMGARTLVLEGDRFAPDVRSAGALFILAPSEPFTPQDVEALRTYLRAGGIAVVAAEVELFHQSLLQAFDIRYAGIAGGGQDLRGAIFAAPRATRATVDAGRTLVPGARWDPLAVDGARRVTAAITREGSGALVVLGSVGPFLAGNLAAPDNARLAVALAAPASAGGAIAFDEYHHGAHPLPDLLAVIERTWPGRALLFAGAVAFLYLVLTGRRLGPALPLDVRPPRSSLDYVRGFAGLVRRSGRGEIARRRLRRELHGGLARAFGLDPATPLDRVLAAVAQSDPDRARESRALDAALAGKLRDDALVRSVATIERLTDYGGARPPRRPAQEGP